MESWVIWGCLAMIVACEIMRQCLKKVEDFKAAQSNDDDLKNHPEAGDADKAFQNEKGVDWEVMPDSGITNKDVLPTTANSATLDVPDVYSANRCYTSTEVGAGSSAANFSAYSEKKEITLPSNSEDFPLLNEKVECRDIKIREEAQVYIFKCLRLISLGYEMQEKCSLSEKSEEKNKKMQFIEAKFKNKTLNLNVKDRCTELSNIKSLGMICSSSPWFFSFRDELFMEEDFLIKRISDTFMMEYTDALLVMAEELKSWVDEESSFFSKVMCLAKELGYYFDPVEIGSDEIERVDIKEECHSYPFYKNNQVGSVMDIVSYNLKRIDMNGENKPEVIVLSD